MKQINRYIAFDGREFSNKTECSKYERIKLSNRGIYDHLMERGNYFANFFNQLEQLLGYRDAKKVRGLFLDSLWDNLKGMRELLNFYDRAMLSKNRRHPPKKRGKQ